MGFCVALLSVMALSPASAKKKKVAPKPAKSAYQKLMDKSGRVSAKGGFVSLHKIQGKLYVELPLKYCGRDFLIASTTSKSSNSKLATVGYKQQDPMCVCFNQQDSAIVLQTVNTSTLADSDLQLAYDRNYANPILKKYKIAAYNADSTAVLFDMTDMFVGDEKHQAHFPKRLFVVGRYQGFRRQCLDYFHPLLQFLVDLLGQ